MKSRLFLLIFTVAFWVATVSQAQTVHLAVAASMTDAIKEVISAFAAKHPLVRVQPNFASSGSLAKQISQGAPADIYISANPKWMAYLVEQQLIGTAATTIFAYNKLVFICGADVEDGSLESLQGMVRIAICDPKSVPAGRYAQQAMEREGIYNQLREQRKFIFAKDVRQALLYADRGEVDGAFVYKTDALLARKAKIAFEVPEELYDRVSYPVGLTLSGEKNAMARALYDFVQGDEAAAIYSKFGFEPAR